MRKLRVTFTLVAVALLCGAPLYAATVVAPNAAATAFGPGGLNSTTRQFERTYQAIYDKTDLAGIASPTNFITGLQWRVWQRGSAFPPIDINWTNFDIYLGHAAPGIAPGTLTTTYANNVEGPGDGLLVRSGKLTIKANAWGPPALNNWGHFYDLTIGLDTLFQYDNNKHLMVTVRHKGNDGNVAMFMDEWSFGGGVHAGYSWQAQPGSYTATTMDSTRPGPLVTRFTHDIPEPAGLSLLGLGALALLRRR